MISSRWSKFSHYTYQSARRGLTSSAFAHGWLARGGDDARRPEDHDYDAKKLKIGVDFVSNGDAPERSARRRWRMA